MAPVVGRITDKATFRALARSKRRGTAGPLTVSYCALAPRPGQTPGGGRPQVGYAVPKSLGNAVVRNRVRRRLRVATRLLAPSLPEGAYLVRAAPGSASVRFDDMVDLLERGFGGAAHGARP